MDIDIGLGRSLPLLKARIVAPLAVGELVEVPSSESAWVDSISSVEFLESPVSVELVTLVCLVSSGQIEFVAVADAKGDSVWVNRNLPRFVKHVGMSLEG